MKRLLSAVCLCSMLACGQSALAQPEDRPLVDSLPEVQAPNQSNRFSNFNQLPGPGIPGMGPGVRQSPMQAAINELKQAESDKDKSAAKEKIKAELEKQYDAFLANDQTRVDQLFDRLKKLEEQLEKRKAAKQRLVELKLEMMVSQAEGLGWPTDNGRIGNYFVPQPLEPGPNPLNNQFGPGNLGNANSNVFIPNPSESFGPASPRQFIPESQPRRSPPSINSQRNNRMK